MPQQWKLGHIIPIHKPQKDEKKCESYRPITLLSNLGKLLERIVCKRLEHYVESNSLLRSNQFGFRPSRSTIDVLLQLEGILQSAMLDGGIAVVIYIDLKAAFDCVWSTGLLVKLSRLGVRGNLLRWMHSYLTDREIQVRVDGYLSNRYRVSRGVPQGASLSPLLFNIMLGDFPAVERVRSLIFADDITIVCSGTNISEVSHRIQEQLDKVMVWSRQWGFTVNPTKTKFQFYTKKRNVTAPTLSLCGEQIQYSKEHKLLGVTLDSPKLTWGAQVRSLHADCLRRVNIMKSLSSINYGACFKNLRLFYIAFIRSKLSYGSAVFAATAKTNMEKLSKIQNSCLRLMLGARRSSPILSMEVEANIPPLVMHFQHLVCREFLRVKYKSGEVNRRLLNIETPEALTVSPKSFTARGWSLMKDCPCILMHNTIAVPPFLTLSPQQSVADYVVINVELRSETQFNDYVRENLGNHCQIFTDGSRRCDPEISVGAGLFVPSLNVASTWLLNPAHMVISAELYAVLQALLFVQQNRINSSVIFSDSRSALESIGGKCKIYTTVCNEIQTLLYTLNRNGTAILQWVKAHVGISGNEMADRAANLGHESDRSALYPLTQQEKTCILKQTFYRKWKEHWYESVRSTNKGKRLRDLRNPGFVSFPLPVLLKNRRDEINIFRLRIGHAGLGSYLFRTNQVEDDSCGCGAAETIEHYLYECPQYERQREQLCYKIAQIIRPYPEITERLLLGLEDFSQEINRKILIILTQYIRETGRRGDI